MNAQNTVFLTQDKSRAVAEGDPDAKFLLVRAGQEIAQQTVEKYKGAMELVGGTKEAPKKESREVETREPEVETREPETPKTKKAHGRH